MAGRGRRVAGRGDGRAAVVVAVGTTGTDLPGQAVDHLAESGRIGKRERGDTSWGDF